MKTAVRAGALVLLSPTLHAQGTPPHDQIFDLASIQAAHDVCGFDLTEEQLDVIDQRRQALTDRDGISVDEMNAVAAQVHASLQRQVAEGLCKPGGAEAQFYKRKLAEYGLL